MITKELLQRNIDYIFEHFKDFNYGSTTRSLFKEGVFNDGNWNGGDSVIRQFLEEYQYDSEITAFEVDDTYLEIISLNDEDDHSITISVRKGHELTNYEFGFYKSRGKTDYAKKDNKSMTEDEYIELLNLIESVTKYSFNFVCI